MGSCTIAVAILIRCFIPLEYVRMSRSCGPAISTVAIARRAAPSGSRSLCRRALARTKFQPVTASYISSRSGTSPTSR